MPFSSAHQPPSLFQELLHLTPPWSVADAAVDPEGRERRRSCGVIRMPRCPARVAARRRRVMARRRAAAGSILFHCGGLDLYPGPA